MSIADELKKLAELRSQGVLSDAEFEAQKSALLSGRSTQFRRLPIGDAGASLHAA